jgi:hypothetical protein
MLVCVRPTLPFAVALALLLALTVAASPVAAQGLPFKVQVLDWEPATLARQMRSYRARADDRELLYCVEGWKVVPVSEEVERVVIERVRLAGSGGANRIGDVGEACLGRSGEPLPMLHTHTEGNCQFSPSDLVTVVARRAPFEGIQCGPQHFTWNFAWQVQAIASSVERARDRLPPY